MSKYAIICPKIFKLCNQYIHYVKKT